MELQLKNQKRQQLVHNLILHQGDLKANEIAKKLKVSIATIRRDLTSLERRGLIERTWGGAKVRSPIEYLADFKSIAREGATEKRSIAAAASQQIKKGMTVGLSGGTTCTELARWLRGKPITVVTNAINVATELYNHSLTKVIVTGGALNSYSYELVGEMVNHTLKEYHLDLCFLGCSGITPEFGFSMRDHYESAIARGFMAVSDRTIVIADHRKAGLKTLSRFSPLNEVNRLITDKGITNKCKRRLEESGLVVECAPNLEHWDSE